MPVLVAKFKEGVLPQEDLPTVGLEGQILTSVHLALASATQATSAYWLETGEFQRISMAHMSYPELTYQVAALGAMSASIHSLDLNGHIASILYLNEGAPVKNIIGKDQSGNERLFALILILSAQEKDELFEDQ